LLRTLNLTSEIGHRQVMQITNSAKLLE